MQGATDSVPGEITHDIATAGDNLRIYGRLHISQAVARFDFCQADMKGFFGGRNQIKAVLRAVTHRISAASRNASRPTGTQIDTDDIAGFQAPFGRYPVNNLIIYGYTGGCRKRRMP